MRQVISGALTVLDSHFEYLRIQKGGLDALALDRPAWLAAYQEDLWRTYTEIQPHLPPECWGSLDIGSGLGGIDVLLSRHYGGELYVGLLDGIDDPPVMTLHRHTFSNAAVAKDFLTTNGVPRGRIRYYAPEANCSLPWDLCVSFGAWMFHFPPDLYLPRLLAPGGMHSETVIIVDVRRGKSEWTAQINVRLREVACLRTTRKWSRMVYGLR